jgi:hypothetical protein
MRNFINANMIRNLVRDRQDRVNVAGMGEVRVLGTCSLRLYTRRALPASAAGFTSGRSRLQPMSAGAVLRHEPSCSATQAPHRCWRPQRLHESLGHTAIV